MRGATVTELDEHVVGGISIHAPHAGRDCRGSAPCSGARHFNPRAPCGARRAEVCGADRRICISIHAPHAGRDQQYNEAAASYFVFQSTRPMRGATRYVRGNQERTCYISIHAPHAGRDFGDSLPIEGLTISIHAPHAGRDRMAKAISAELSVISIHAPHAGRDRAFE